MKRVLLVVTVFGLFANMLTAQTPQELKGWLPEVNGWTITEEIEVFDPDNLFDRINGAAPLFIENNFREMTSMEYKHNEQYITIQAYRHATPEDAFGMYASERSTELEHFPIGGEAQGDEANLFFFAGNVYVKMRSSVQTGTKAALHAIAEGLAQKLDADAGYPTLFDCFPVGKVMFSESYITANYIGHEFLNNVYVARYVIDGKEFQLFVIDGKTKEGAKEVMTKYYAFARQTDAFAEGAQTIKDRYNGDIPVIWKDRYILGLFSENGDEAASKELLEKTAACL